MKTELFFLLFVSILLDCDVQQILKTVHKMNKCMQKSIVGLSEHQGSISVAALCTLHSGSDLYCLNLGYLNILYSLYIKHLDIDKSTYMYM